MINKRNREQLAKSITICGSIFWIFIGVWGFHSCLEAAKETRAQYVQSLGLTQSANRSYPLQLTTWTNPPARNEMVYRQLELEGLARNPYIFADRVMTPMMIFLLCIAVSFFVLYAALIVNPKRKYQINEAKTESSFDISRYN